ncbi:MAG: CDP-glycerol glycerophosphotransferase family protein [Eggerthellaceae bacterium]
MRSLLLHIIACALRACALVFRLVPVRPRVAFMSRQGRSGSMDFRILEAALRERMPQVELVECVTDPETKNLLKFACNTLRQLRLSQTSRVVVADGYLPAVSVPAKRKGVTVIQLWHALGAIKCFGYQCLDTTDGRSSDSARILRMHRNYDYVIAGGPWAVEALAKAFDVPAETVLPLGLPRLDYLMAPGFVEERAHVHDRIVSRYPQLAQPGPKVLLAPTFRRNDAGFSASQLALACKAADGLPATVIFSGHPLDASGKDAGLPRNVVLASGFPTIQLLLVADVLVTDYSAVAYEAAAMGLPVFFYVPDIDVYRNTPGLNIDPEVEYPQCTSRSLRASLSLACSDSSRGDALAKSMGDVPEDCIGRIMALVGHTFMPNGDDGPFSGRAAGLREDQ